MVKGVTRRVIVVRSPDPRFFEEAIFVVKEDITTKDGISSEELMREAQGVANGYIKNHIYKSRLWGNISPWIFAAAGATASGAIFYVVKFFL